MPTEEEVIKEKEKSIELFKKKVMEVHWEREAWRLFMDRNIMKDALGVEFAKGRCIILESYEKHYEDLINKFWVEIKVLKGMSEKESTQWDAERRDEE